MLKISTFLDFCNINYTEKSQSKLDKLVNKSMEKHMQQWLENLKQKIENEMSFECPVCYNNTDKFKELQFFLAFHGDHNNNPDIDGKYVVHVFFKM